MPHDMINVDPVSSLPHVSGESREWRAELTLSLEDRDNKTALITNQHFGPLRVQRPFYPEYINEGKGPQSCHLYLLHPPGGIVLGDRLKIDVLSGKNTSTLMTTPSAGKIYGVKGKSEKQLQSTHLKGDADSCIEWLPQETIVFDGANAHIVTKLELESSARAFIWDIVCLGRPASNESFSSGRCNQTLEIWQDKQLLLLERNRFDGGSELLQSPWGLNRRNTSGTLCATVKPSRDAIDQLLEELDKIDDAREHSWGISQKNELLIARYLGNSSYICREGFTHIWKALRTQLNGKTPVVPRIWHT